VLSHVARTLFANESHARTLESQKEHKLIAEAFRTKDLKQIAKAVTNHLKNAEKHILGKWE
jgi:DNA-binding GntR family transcriptional regulator